MSKDLIKFYRISLVLVFATSMVVSLTFLDPINWPKQILLSITAGYFFIHGLLIADRSQDNYARRFIVGVCCAGICYIVPVFFTSVDVSRFFWGVFGRNNGFVTNISLFIVGAASFLYARNGGSLIDFLRISSVFSFLSALYGYIQVFEMDFVSWSKTNEVFAFFGNSNFASAAFAIGAISSLLLCIDSYKGSRRYESLFSGFGFVLLFSITYFTSSIQGVTAIIICLFLIILAYIFNLSRVVGWLILSLGITTAFLVLLGFYGRGLFGSYLYQYTLVLRYEYWMAGVRMGLDHLFFGVGYESYGDFFQRYRSDKVAQMTGVGLTTNNAHNPFIQAFATLGLVGTIPLVLFFLISLISSIRGFLSLEEEHQWLSKSKMVSILFLTSWIMAFFSIDNIAIAVLNWTIMGLAFGVSRPNLKLDIQSPGVKDKSNRTKQVRVKKWTQYRSLLSSIIILIFFTFSWVSSAPNRALASLFDNSQKTDTNPNWLDLRQKALLGVVENPMSREVEFKWAAEGFYNLGLESATINTLLLGLRKFPQDMTLLDNLAFVYERKSAFEDAIKVRRVQLELESRNWKIYYFLAMNLQKIDKLEEAQIELAKIDDLKQFMSEDEVRMFADIKRNFGK